MSGARLTLGDAGAPNDDVSYGGNGGALSLDYVRGKMREFQEALNAADVAYQAADAVYRETDPPSETLYALLIDYESKAQTLKTTAQTLNLAADAVNAMGGRLPALSIPGTLGLPAFVLPAAAVAAVAAVAGIVSWKISYVAGVKRGIEEAKAIVRETVSDPVQRDETLARMDGKLAEIRAAESFTTGTALDFLGQSFGGIAKIAIVGLLGYLAWRSFEDTIDRQ